MLSISHLGTTLVYCALGGALLQFLLPFAGYLKRNTSLLALARPCAFMQSFFILNAFLLLIIAFLSNDFSLTYVAKNSHPSLPFFYRLTAVWGAHEGSFLLWIFLFDVWTLALCLFNREGDAIWRALSLSLLGCISFCFLLFLTLTSNPFATTTYTIPQDLNPLLQDPGFFVHPPLLYAGYVGFCAVFALTLSGLLYSPSKETGYNWAQAVRPWVLSAWSFLTIGITLGSWWAYHVLGWGGFWFWDPVENASLLPWLAGAALLHLVIVAERDKRFQSWAQVLAILSFSLSILGTFLVRSGILISVHSFASDPSRGTFLLLLLAFITGPALLLCFFRSFEASRLPQQNRTIFSWSSREALLIIQSLLLFTAMTTVLLGTVYPLIMESLGLGTLSVGPPYFNQVLFPLLVLCLLLMGWAPFSQWGVAYWNHAILSKALRQLVLSILLAVSLTLFFAQQWQSAVIFNLSLIFWVFFSLNKIPLKQITMALAHLGFALVVLSIVLSSAFSQEREVRLHIGEEVTLAPYTLQFRDVQGQEGPNYKGVKASFTVLLHHKKVTELYPEKRIYTVRGMVMTKVAIYPGVFHDLYLALGEPLTENTWSLRVYYKPFIRWLWVGGFCIAISGFLALLRKARRKS